MVTTGPWKAKLLYKSLNDKGYCLSSVLTLEKSYRDMATDVLYIKVTDVFKYRKFLQQIDFLLKKKQSHKLTGVNCHSSFYHMQWNLQQLKVIGGIITDTFWSAVPWTS